MTTASVWDSSQNTQLSCCLNPMHYPKPLLEEFNLIIFKVWILLDSLSCSHPGWNLKGASVVPKWNFSFLPVRKKSTISKLAVNAVLFHAALGRIRKLLYAAVTAETRLP